MISFDVKKAPLRGSNLIEASAGTGKTFSIAILMLRLILEKGLSPKQIVLVTFTKSAVAELDTRVGVLIRKIYQFLSHGVALDDDLLEEILAEAIKKTSKEEVQRRIKTAVFTIDEAMICTIHSFCQQILAEFSFETGQNFGLKLAISDDEYVQKVVSDYWRRSVTSLPIDVLESLLALKVEGKGLFSTELLQKILKEELGGKSYSSESYESVASWEKDKKKLIDDELNYEEAFKTVFFRNKEKYQKGWYNLGKLLNDANAFCEEYVKVLKAKDAKYLKKDESLYEIALQIIEVQTQLKLADKKLLATIVKQMLKDGAVTKVQELKEAQSVLTFNDLISDMWRASIEKKEELRDLLQPKFWALFVDEFQDTNKAQYEVFDNLFAHSQTTIFYIGDPKQSIYSFQKADVNTYKRARRKVDRCYSMTVNYRSTPSLLQSLNQFFIPKPSFNTFLDKEIEYVPVGAGRKDLGSLSVADKVVLPITCTVYTNKDDRASKIVRQIYDLLQMGILDGRKVKPSDIGILIRGKSHIDEIKKELNLYDIPTTMVNDTKVLTTDQAEYVLYLLMAILEPSSSSINRALLSAYHGVQLQDMLSLDEGEVMEIFSQAQFDFDSQGVFVSLNNLFNKLGLIPHLLTKGITGKRILVNILHIVELIHQLEKNKNLSLLDLVAWLQRASEQSYVMGDEYLQRVEGDENAVQIVTIHKSKGLAYNIVFFVDFESSKKERTIESFFNPDEQQYYCSTQLSEKQELWRKEGESQEDRRLLYVALTRAVYKCYITYKAQRNNQTELSLIQNFVLPRVGDETIDWVEELEEPEAKYLTQSASETPVIYKDVTWLPDYKRWKTLSFSALNEAHGFSPILQEVEGYNTYDEFVLKKMPRGAVLGNFLHQIFEQIDFSSSQYWEQTVDRISPFYESIYLEEDKENYLLFIHQVLEATMPFGGSLKEIKYYKKINELKFYYPINDFKLKALKSTFPLLQLDGTREYDGVIQGFIDLFFEHQGKYYALDWKSNYLGNHVEAYHQSNLSEAMTENGYDLQALIYAYASCLYLKQRIPGFDIDKDFGGTIYLFMRGMRSGEFTGIHYIKFSNKDFNKIDKVMNQK